MTRLCVALSALALAGCGETLDERPRTFEYLTTAVLAPSCGNAQCHSTFRRADDIALDTVEAARRTITGQGLVAPLDPARSRLHEVLVAPLGGTIPRMPYDRPMPDRDVALIEDWIAQGAPGAACDPALQSQLCVGDELYACAAGFSLGDYIEDCAARTAGPNMRFVCSVDACVEVSE